MRLTTIGVAIMAACVVVGAAHAQQGTTDADHERDDAAYLERLKRAAAAEQASPGPLTDFDAFVTQADSLVRDRNYRSASSERYRVQTDDPRFDAEAAVALLDSFAAFVDERWSGRLALRPFGEQARVFLFYSFHKYNTLLGADFSRSFVRPKGHYGTVIDAIAAHTDADVPGGFADSLVHEAAHQLVARRFFPDGVLPSPWLAEGLGSYFGFMRRDESGRFVEREVGGKRAGLIRGEGEGRPIDARATIRHVRRLLRDRPDGGTVVGRIVDIHTPAEFYGGSPTTNYGVSWLVVHALLHADDGAHRAGFLRYLEREREGASGLDELVEASGLDPAALDELVRAHLSTIEIR